MGSILVVDDDEAVRTVVAEAVTILGHHVRTAQDGREALAMFDAERFDCVVTDLAMPEIDGLTLLRRIKRKRPSTGVLVLTGNTTMELLAASVNTGADAYVTKPFRIAELDEQLHRLLAEAVSRPGSALAPAATDRIGASTRRAISASVLAVLLGLFALLMR